MRYLARIAVVLIVFVMSSSGVPGQTPATRQTMRMKLVHTQQVLEALMTSDYPMLNRESQALAGMVKAPGWYLLQSPRYQRYSDSFVRAADDLTEAATLGDSDAAMRSYVSLTLSCYQCHSYVKGSRIAK